MKKTYGFLICIFPYFIMLLIRAVTAVIFESVFAEELSIRHDTYLIYELALIAVTYILVFGCWYYFRFAKKNETAEDDFFTIKSLVFLFLLGIMVQLAASCLLYFILSLMPSMLKAYSTMMSPLLQMSGPAVFYVGILSPIGEELIFRGLILQYAGLETKFYMANILQAALFGVFHGNIVQGLYTFLLGLLLGYVVRLSKSIFGGIILHSAINFAGLYLDKLFPNTLPVMVRLVLMTAAVLVSVWIIKGMKECSQGKS